MTHNYEGLRSYRGVFEALDAERVVLEDMYRTLMDRVASDDRLARFGLVVEREVRIEDWVAAGEALFDLRRPPFPGHGLLEAAAKTTLLGSWATGTGEEVEAAMGAFLQTHFSAASISLAQGVSLSQLGEWLFSTDHVRVRYAIEYEGVPLERLSPGTKCVVLLMLYLALDQWDMRPLVIDQPEENLDPRSVYSTLVPFFREAALRRQIIMVTHNANLVVATDSDQVIVADAVRTSPTDLPVVTYRAGGLEDGAIRGEVCRLLEGGEDAFRKRGVRYGVTLGGASMLRAE